MGSDTSMIKIGPVGNKNDGEGPNVWDEKGRSQVVQIFISCSDQLHSLQFQYFENGALVLSERYGEIMGDNFRVVKLDYPSEYLTSIGGLKDYNSITSITFHTNLPFSSQEEFCIEMGEEDPQFGGFHGSLGSDGISISSIGVYINPITTLNVANAGNVEVDVK